MTLSVQWIDRRRSPRHPPDPTFPHGVDVDLSGGDERPTCFTTLPYPARRLGYYFIKCDRCGQSMMVTTAGRPDDPRSVKVACKLS